MKIRSGFVSNSSSSSFIVAFPKKPESATDVLNMMFKGNAKGQVKDTWGDETMTHEDICRIVFSDIKAKIKSKSKITKKAIAEDLSGRYHVWNGRLNNETDRYYAIDKPLAETLVQLAISEEKEDRDFRDFERKFLVKHGLGIYPGYAYKGGINNTTKKPFTDEEIDKYNDYVAAVDLLKKTNEEYKTREEKNKQFHHHYWEESSKIRNALGEIDADEFFKDNKGKFIVQLSYSDNDGQSLLEHSNIFYNLPHIQISHH